MLLAVVKLSPVHDYIALVRAQLLVEQEHWSRPRGRWPRSPRSSRWFSASSSSGAPKKGTALNSPKPTQRKPRWARRPSSIDDVHVKYKAYESGRRVRRGRRLLEKQAGIKVVHAVKGVSLVAREGESIGVVGHNGSGKSSLLNAIAGLIPPAEGAVYASSQPAILGVEFHPHAGSSWRQERRTRRAGDGDFARGGPRRVRRHCRLLRAEGVHPLADARVFGGYVGAAAVLCRHLTPALDHACRRSARGWRQGFPRARRSADPRNVCIRVDRILGESLHGIDPRLHALAPSGSMAAR